LKGSQDLNNPASECEIWQGLQDKSGGYVKQLYSQDLLPTTGGQTFICKILRAFWLCQSDSKGFQIEN